MKEKIDLSIIIVNYNTPNLLYNCLRSIKKHLHLEYEIIIVENSPEPKLRVKDELLKKILSKDTAFKLLVLDNNLGFGQGNNFGVKQASGKLLFLLNPDTLIVDNSVEKMFKFLSAHTEIGALTCLLYNDYEQKKIQQSFFGNFQSLASLTFKRYSNQKIDYSKEFFYADTVTGAALMVKKTTFNKVGGFDKNIFMYLEDDDLCKKIVDLGYKNAVLTSAKIIHLEGQASSNKKKKQYYYQSQDYYWRKHNGFWATILMKILRWPLKIIKTV